MEVRATVPEGVADLAPEEKAFLGALAESAPAAGSDGETWQSAIFTTASARELPAGRAFKALYVAFLGRTNGPRAGWLLASLDRSFVVERLRAAAAAATLPA
jgi:lysyl-tRNA synthetase class 1